MGLAALPRKLRLADHVPTFDLDRVLTGEGLGAVHGLIFERPQLCGHGQVNMLHIAGASYVDRRGREWSSMPIHAALLFFNLLDYIWPHSWFK